mgnify:CR=1 FL=1
MISDSIGWLRDYLKVWAGGLIVISHDVELLEAVVNKVFHLDANRAELDIYSMNWKRYLQQRETDEKRRKRERVNAERKAEQLLTQAAKMGAKATKATAAQGMLKRAERLRAGVEDERAADRVAKIRFPDPAPCGKTPLTAEGLSKSYGSLEIFTGVDLAIDRGSRVVILGLNGARLYRIPPVPPRCDFTRRQLARIREELRDGDRVLGPRLHDQDLPHPLLLCISPLRLPSAAHTPLEPRRCEPTRCVSTTPTASMSANIVVGLTCAKPSRLSSLESATDSGDCVGTSA